MLDNKIFVFTGLYCCRSGSGPPKHKWASGENILSLFFAYWFQMNGNGLELQYEQRKGKKWSLIWFGWLLCHVGHLFGNAMEMGHFVIYWAIINPIIIILTQCTFTYLVNFLKYFQDFGASQSYPIALEIQ
jgi:hypothetical protein